MSSRSFATWSAGWRATRPSAKRDAEWARSLTRGFQDPSIKHGAMEMATHDQNSNSDGTRTSTRPVKCSTDDERSDAILTKVRATAEVMGCELSPAALVL